MKVHKTIRGGHRGKGDGRETEKREEEGNRKNEKEWREEEREEMS